MKRSYKRFFAGFALTLLMMFALGFIVEWSPRTECAKVIEGGSNCTRIEHTAQFKPMGLIWGLAIAIALGAILSVNTKARK